TACIAGSFLSRFSARRGRDSEESRLPAGARLSPSSLLVPTDATSVESLQQPSTGPGPLASGLGRAGSGRRPLDRRPLRIQRQQPSQHFVAHVVRPAVAVRLPLPALR